MCRKRGRIVLVGAVWLELSRADGGVRVGFIGSGNYATGVLIPAFKAAGAALGAVVSSGGVSAVHAGRKYAVQQASTDAAGVVADLAINTLVVATRHDSHARYVCDALAAGKHVSALLFDDVSKGSWEEAVNTLALMRCEGWKRVLIVSDSRHLWRLNWIWRRLSAGGLAAALVAPWAPVGERAVGELRGDGADQDHVLRVCAPLGVRAAHTRVRAGGL
jgi:hypothetical protein